MKQEFIDYELHLRMFIDAGADAHARHLVGEPIKPEGYDEYIQSLNPEKEVVKEEIKEFSYLEFMKKLDLIEQNKDKKEQGMLFDEDGIPQYLSADDHYNGIQNPEWVKKHEKNNLQEQLLWLP